ncbi:rRNA small subunit methyltransferase H [Salinispira pacifica]|uniref:Ribosomal RNA small subunit methyltransferase H n=1 Tax=Salinispira pacifica TaxID=1307761 RepID=V5WFK7_9SPIO|nr:rRNA small subunit methyltransferase H [Salinispira pacifica]
MDIQHTSVLAEEVIEYLAPDRENGIFIDCTLGEGGHSERILESFSGIRLVGIDTDAAIQAKAKRRLEPYKDRTTFYNGFFDEFFRDYPLEEPAHRILFDLGISIFHYNESGRGFSFYRDEPLDMRLNPHRGRPVQDILAGISEAELRQLLFDYGEERYGRRIAAAIIRARDESAITSSLQLAGIIENAVPAAYRYGKIHAATRSFQALRILANAELERIEPAMEDAFRHLETGGRMGIISFHSLEDRIVKHRMKEWAKSCICPPEVPMCECGGNLLFVCLSERASPQGRKR